MTVFSLSLWSLSCQVNSFWAELCSLKKEWKEYIYQKESWYWQRQSPILFPIVWALLNGKYQYKNSIYSMSQHGFARDMEWKLLENNETSCTFLLQDSEETRKVYPFSFDFSVRYSLITDWLHVDFSIKNRWMEGAIMPVSFGAHPAFSFDGDISEYSVIFPDDTILLCDRLEKWLLSHHEIFHLHNHTLQLSEKIFERDAIILRQLHSQRCIFQKGNKEIFTFHRWLFPHFALWKQPGAHFICFEPWHGFADIIDASWDLKDKLWILLLSPNHEVIHAWNISL